MFGCIRQYWQPYINIVYSTEEIIPLVITFPSSYVCASYIESMIARPVAWYADENRTDITHERLQKYAVEPFQKMKK